MPSKKPTQLPKELQVSGESNMGSAARPNQVPPIISETGAMDMSELKPQDLTPEEKAMAAMKAPGEAKPEDLPPQVAAGDVGGAMVWVSNKKITALWSINQNRNVYVNIDTVGWKKLANNSDSAIVAFNILSASARQTQTAVNYREEADGMIHELYVW